MNITIYHQNSRNEVVDQLHEAMLETDLKFFASELLPNGFNNMQQLYQAVERAIQICQAASIPVRNNFKSVYISNQGIVTCDWKLSSLARKLVIVNADASIPFVARTQLELVGNYE